MSEPATPGVKLIYGRIVLYSNARRTVSENRDVALQALALLLDIPVESIAEYANREGKEIIVQTYRSY